MKDYIAQYGMDFNPFSKIGNRIRIRREELNITRNELSEILYVTPKFCSDIENGARGMSLNTLTTISETLCMSTDYILFGERTEHDKTAFAQFAEKIPQSQAPAYLRICKEIEKLNQSDISDK